MPEAQKALKKILADERLTGVPLMVLANKKDLPNSMTIREVRNSATTTPKKQLNSLTTDILKEAI